MRYVLFETREIFHEEGGSNDNGDDYLRKMMATIVKKAWAVLPWDFHDQVQFKKLQGCWYMKTQGIVYTSEVMIKTR